MNCIIILFNFKIVLAAGRLTALQSVFVNPLWTNRPCVYTGGTGGQVQVIIPTGKFGSLYDQVCIIIKNSQEKFIL